jgi:hypothetical protein
MGECIRNPECKRIMSGIAEGYARLAQLTKDFQKAATTPLTVDQQKTEGLRKRVGAGVPLLGPNPK